MNELWLLELAPFLFFPGFFLALILGLFKEEKSLVEVFAISAALSVAFDSLFLFANSQVFNVGVKGVIGAMTVTLLGLSGVTAGRLTNRRNMPNVKLSKLDAWFGLLTLIEGFVIALQFIKYPLFPEIDSQDFLSHGEIVNTLINQPIPFAQNILYYGIHYILAFGTVLSGESGIFAARDIMGILALLSPFWVFYATKNLFDSERAALAISGVYVLTGTVWFGMVFVSGLYPNFYAILASMLLIGSLAALMRDRNKGNWSVYLLALAAASLSHFSLILIFPAMVVYILAKSRGRNKLNAVASVPILASPIALLIFPSLLGVIASLYRGSSGFNLPPTFLSSVFASIPSVANIFALMQDDFAALSLILLSVAYVWKLKAWKKAEVMLPLVWFLTVMALAPQNDLSWRFSFDAIMPLVMMAGFALHSFTPKKKERFSITERMPMKAMLLLAVVVPSSFLGSWTTQGLTAAASDTMFFNHFQNEEYTAMQWMSHQNISYFNPKDNKTHYAEATYISVTDWRFRYADYLVGNAHVIVNYQDMSGPDNAAFDAVYRGAEYFIVTNITQYPFDSSLTSPGFQAFFQQLNPFLTFNNQTLTGSNLAYSSPNVRIFCVNQNCRPKP